MHAHTSPVILDYTLEDLYSLGGGKASDVVLAFAFPIPRVQAASSLPLSRKLTLLQRVPQRYGFVAGKMPLVLFELDLDDHENKGQGRLPLKMRAHHIDAMETYWQLSPDHQPKVSFARSPADVVLQPNVRLAVLSPVDWLVYSGLPTPASLVIDCHLLPPQVQDSSLVEAEIQRMLRTVHEKDLPFIVQVPQSISSQGTFTLRTESDRQEAITVLRDELRAMIQELSFANQHLFPRLDGLSFFVTCKARGVFIGCCKQLFDDSSLWTGGCISYPEQPQLQEEYAEIMDDLARFLHSKGYYGPAGAGIVISPNGRLLVIDMKIRVTGTLHLGCLRSHFLQRGLSEATLLYPLYVGCSRDDFRQYFRSKLKEGSMIISSWITNPDPKPHAVAITIAGVDRLGLGNLITIINAFKASVTCG
ncbi:hypothetical protein BDV41DRAFT_560996 [Aspergillus transmontanensis]|uniref:ATP-grasp domain-containing protein n=1 Tax=Aspergillus transmontanensis TaxID=1034304 RepID=A0A5N6WC66_9EURO|nr:hypothetical protein BDV41DRAFT_560996 [Aspergillus transmontanensis]